MKREAGDGPQGGGPQKRYRGNDGNEIRLLIPSKVAGSIIGKGGHNISKLRSEHNASVTVPDCPGPERILTVAADLDTMLRVVSEILPNLEDNNRGRRNQDSGEEVDIRMLVHQSQAGCIIGKGGLKIKELREKTGARIKIYSNCCPQSTDRIVQINGKGNLCVDAIRECMELLKTSPVKGINNPYDPHNFDEYFSQEYGGYGGSGDDRRGGRGPNSRGPPGRGGGPGNFGGPRGNFGGHRGGGGSFGGRGPMGGPLGGPMGGPMGNGMGLNAPGPMGMGMGGPGPQAPGNFGGPTSLGADKNSTQVTIPKDLAGAIIGKGGSRIRKIRMESGAGITIDEPLPGANDRIITISGSPTQIQMAQYLLQQSVRENTKDY